MKIELSFKEASGEGPCVTRDPSQLYYDAYLADFRIVCDGEPTIVVPEGPALHFLTALQSMFLECFLTRSSASTYLFETGAQMFATLEGDTIDFEIPVGGRRFRCPVSEFVVALKDATLELLWFIYDHEPKLLAQKGLFKEGSIEELAARLILGGKLPRDQQ